MLIGLASCSKDDVNTDTGQNSGMNPDNVVEISKILEGKFTGQNGYKAEGTATLGKTSNGDHYIRLQNDFNASFATGSVTMYLSSSANLKLADNTTFIKLATINKKGTHDFKLASQPNASFLYVIVWCSPAAIQFGVAEMK
jgi:hypothetical protein